MCRVPDNEVDVVNLPCVDPVIVLPVGGEQMPLGVAHLARQSGNAVSRDIRNPLGLKDLVDLLEVCWKYVDLLAVENGLLSHGVFPDLGYLVPVPEFHNFIIQLVIPDKAETFPTGADFMFSRTGTDPDFLVVEETQQLTAEVISDNFLDPVLEDIAHDQRDEKRHGKDAEFVLGINCYGCGPYHGESGGCTEYHLLCQFPFRLRARAEEQHTFRVFSE